MVGGGCDDLGPLQALGAGDGRRLLESRVRLSPIIFLDVVGLTGVGVGYRASLRSVISILSKALHHSPLHHPRDSHHTLAPLHTCSPATASAVWVRIRVRGVAANY